MIGVTIVLLAGLYMLAWTNYYYVYYHQKMFHNYPEPVGMYLPWHEHGSPKIWLTFFQ